MSASAPWPDEMGCASLPLLLRTRLGPGSWGNREQPLGLDRRGPVATRGQRCPPPLAHSLLTIERPKQINPGANPPNGFRIPSAEQLSRPFSVAVAGPSPQLQPRDRADTISARPARGSRANPRRSLSFPARSRSADWRLIMAAIEGLFVLLALNPLIP